MKRPLLFVVVAVFAFLVASKATRRGIDWLRREPAVSSTIVTKPWVEQVLIPNSIAVDVPWPLQREELKLPQEVARLISSSVSLAHEADGLQITSAITSFIPGTPANLDGAADGALANLKTVPGTRSVDGKKMETFLLGVRAIELDARIERERGVALQLHGVVLLHGNDLFQLHVISRSDQPLGAVAWERLRNSIRHPKAT